MESLALSFGTWHVYRYRITLGRLTLNSFCLSSCLQVISGSVPFPPVIGPTWCIYYVSWTVVSMLQVKDFPLCATVCLLLMVVDCCHCCVFSVGFTNHTVPSFQLVRWVHTGLVACLRWWAANLVV